MTWRAIIGIEAGDVPSRTERTQRTEPTRAAESGISVRSVHSVPTILPDRSAAEWRARFELLAATRWHVEGYERDAARRWAYLELLCEWVESQPSVNALPSAEAEPIAVAALETLGICAPRGR